jgi:hypothetical protein
MGLKPRALSGDIAFIGRLSYRYTLHNNLYFLSTINIGQTWDEGDFLYSLHTIGDFVRYAPIGLGLGISYNTLFGPISLSWGKLIHNKTALDKYAILDENVMYFSAGFDF